MDADHPHRPPAETIARFLAGTASNDERDEITTWLNTDPAARSLLEGLPAPEPIDASSIGSRIVTAAVSATRQAQQQQEIGRMSRPRTRKPYSPFSWPARVAATFVVLVLSLSVWFVSRDTRTPEEATVFQTQNAQRLTVRLGDGTEVNLNADSRLEIAPDFGLRERRVQLTGQAYFDVAPDVSRPFMITAAATHVRVVGTTFDVRAYRDEPVAVVVEEGRVEFAISDSPAAATQRVLLHPGESGQVALVAGRDSIIVASVDPTLLVRWRDGVLQFHGAPLAKVATQLERWFDVIVEMDDQQLASRRLDASFDNESLEEVCNRIATALGLQIVVDGRRVLVSEKKSGER